MAPPRTRPRRLLAPSARRLLASLAAALLALVLTAAPAGANVISPEPPHSPNADDINTLYWIGLVVMLALIAAVNAPLLVAVSRYRERRGLEPRRLRGPRSIQIRVAGALAALALGFFVVSVAFTEGARDPGPTGPQGLQPASVPAGEAATEPPIGGSVPPPSRGDEPLEITATAQQWLWRYTYPNGAFSYYRLVVPVDTAVQLNLVSTDVVHGWFVPELGGKFDAVPGKTNPVRLRADETGTYEGRSSTFSGAAYAADRIEVQVVTPDEYETYLEGLERDIQEAQDIVVGQIQSGQVPGGETP